MRPAVPEWGSPAADPRRRFTAGGMSPYVCQGPYRHRLQRGPSAALTSVRDSPGVTPLQALSETPPPLPPLLPPELPGSPMHELTWVPRLGDAQHAVPGEEDMEHG